MIRIASKDCRHQRTEKFSLNAELEKDSPQNRISLAEQLLAIFYDQTSDPKARCAALEAVSPINLDHVYQAIDIAYKDDEPEFKVSAIYAMGTNANPSWLPVIISELSNPDPEMRYEAAHAAGELGQEDALPDLLLLAQDDDKDVQVAAILALGKIGGREARQNLVKLAEHSDQAIREAAEQSLHELELSNNPFSIKSFDCNNSSSS
jgi:HEAT repeat protein